MRRPKALFCGFLSFTFLFLLFPRFIFADFKLLDAIKEFGEKRFTEPQPTRLKAGPVRIHPTARTSIEYDDNILLEHDDAREDVVFNLRPGAIVEIPVDKHQLTLGYEAQFEIFTKTSRQNDQNQNFFALADLHFPSWYVNVLETFAETSSRSGTTFSDRIPRYDQAIHPKVGYRWKRVIFEAGFRHFLRDFRRQVDDARDFQLVEWTGVIYYDLFAKLKALAEYQVAQIDYDDSFVRNGTFQQTRAGLEGEIFPNSFVKVRVGPQFRNYEVSSKPNFNSWVADLAVDYDIRKNLKLRFSASRNAVEATFGSINFYKEHALRFGFEYTFIPRWIFFTSAGYIRHDYAERATADGLVDTFRHDNHVTVETGIRFLPREWLEFQLAYEHLHRESNFATFDYSDNRISFTSALTY